MICTSFYTTRHQNIILRRENCNPHLLCGEDETWSYDLSEAQGRGCSWQTRRGFPPAAGEMLYIQTHSGRALEQLLTSQSWTNWNSRQEENPNSIRVQVCRQLALGRNLALIWLLIKTQFKLRNTYLLPLLDDFSYLPVRGLIHMTDFWGILCTVLLKLLVWSCYVTSSELL